jgi:tetratricopeptide (TPR) repeat protein
VTTYSAGEEELFDTQTATAQIERGVKLLGARNYTAAIEAFEEAVSAAPSAEAHYLLGYAYYMKGKTGDGDSRQKSMENFEQAYLLDPNFSPSKIGPAEIMEVPQSGHPAAETPAAAAPASALESGAAAPKTDAPPARPAQ